MAEELLDQSGASSKIDVFHPHKSTINAIVRVLKAEDRYEAVRSQSTGDIENNPKVIKARQVKEAAEQARNLTPEYRAKERADEASKLARAEGDEGEANRQRNIAINALRAQFNATIEATRIFNLQKATERMKGTGFIVGGRNETSVIRSLAQINGIPIAELERNMRGGFDGTAEDIEDFRDSVGEMPKPPLSFVKLQPYFGIFLGPEESLINLLAEDNDTVLNIGLTHQELADFLDNFIPLRPLHGAPAYIEGQSQGIPYGTFTFNNISYYLEVIGGRGGEGSPFQDGLAGSYDFFITRIDSGAQIHFGSMQPELMRRYGFYEGKQTAYRIDPRKLAEFADLTPKRVGQG